jgi:hypothetical protein
MNGKFPFFYGMHFYALALQFVLGTELSLSSRGRMTQGVQIIFWFISHTLPQCHALQRVGDTYL